ncbi:hypothetical protein H4S03_006791 [Coemansia sp. S3946]|nr:hypothetical protein H4S03_006791 [Coemansia sp. S3946]
MTASKVVPALLGGFICIYGLVSGFVKERLFLSEALVAMLFGIVIGPQAINLVDPHDFVDTGKFTLEFARYVIAIQVMAAGITLPHRYMVRKWRTMSVLLGPVMIVMWLVTAGIIHLMFDLSFKQSLLIASCAAPTDPILANSVVKGRYAEANVPKNVRDALSAESGINDGLGLPFLYFALYLLNESFSTGHAMGRWFYWIWCYNILLSVVIGIVVGYVARKLLRLAEAYDLIDKESFLAFSIGLAVFLVGCLQLIRSDDVLCCFIAGHSFTWDDWFREETKDAHFQEVLDGLINVSFFIYFGTIIPWHQFNNVALVIAPWRLIVAAIMVLLLRRLPVVVLLTRITPAFRNYRQSIFAGWFGPIGVGALFFAEIVMEEIEHEPEHFHIRSREIIVPIISFLVFSSVLVHGITLPLVYIGKVVRSRSRSLTSMRSGIVSRLSFINSREPNGIHGVHIPMMDDSTVGAGHYSEPALEKRDVRRSFFSVDQSPESASEETQSPHGSGRSEGDGGPAASLDLTRTITIDDTPKVSRDQMDIHYRIAGAHRQYQQHAQSLQTPTALSAPGYSRLQPSGGLLPVPSRVHSAQDVVPYRHSLGSSEDIIEPVVEEPKAVHARSRELRYSASAEIYGDTRESRPPSLKEGAGLQAEVPASISSSEHPAATPTESDNDGLVLAADETIASRRASRTTTQNTVMSNPELPTASPESPLPAISIHPSLLQSSSVAGSPPVAAAAHRRDHHNHHHRLRLRRHGSLDSSGVSLPQHTGDLRHQHRFAGGRGQIRRILRRRNRHAPAQPLDALNEEEPACEFIGNRRNPLGRLEDGELVDYDDPNDIDAEQSFTDNNVEDRIMDYFALDIGHTVRRLRSWLPGTGRHHTEEP